MPYYQVHHTYPLSLTQRQSIALSITNLHCGAFNTPASFVHVSFSKQDPAPDDGTYFMAGKSHPDISNRIVAVVRTSASRTKDDFDNLAASIEDAWNGALREGNSNAGGGAEQAGQAEQVEVLDASKRLTMVVFTPLLAVREGGMAVPEAGHEEAWLKQQLPYIKEMAEKHNDAGFKLLLEELNQREAVRG
ncbi:hypothetical protein CTA2_2451 [Colletotrichum tanaceti]|uniref:Tautomerase cis-CaaD-like domain-containing protein n=1 Tax=Colletotrichum tanaceti TaxID=1306861 RepID=A0A4U6X3A7_9PEZI|nr:hypothetical protein CTA2_2451 [Colletotrichum tanaceti]TKW49858.1 hypothetical protein CTA1_1150 [Colletotrichum tanaceti]